jgi:glycerol uptake facilitator-like aquaporin
MIALTFSPGTWVGTSTATVYLLHAAGVITADRFFGGDVNPAVSFCMYSLGKFKLRSFVTKISAQLLGGLVAFFLFSYLATTFSLPQFGGPSLPRYKTDDAVEVCFMNELTGTFLLLTTIFTVNWEIVFLAGEAKRGAKRLELPSADLPYDKLTSQLLSQQVPDQNYFIKQTLTAFVIRLLIMTFPNSGPALNPMLATAYAVHENTKIDDVHILVYWVAPILGGCLAAVGYVFYTGGEGAQFFGYDLKFAPRDKTKPVLNIAPIKAIPNTAPPKVRSGGTDEERSDKLQTSAAGAMRQQQYHMT